MDSVKRVLIVDDEEAVRRLLSRILIQRLRFEVVEEPTGLAAKARLEGDEYFDCIISDVVMPGMSGVELLEAVQKMPHRRGTPFVFMSGWMPNEIAESFAALGTVPFLAKPFSLAEIESLFKKK